MKALLLAATLLTGSASAQEGSWRAVATPNDRERLREWRTAWMAALPGAPRVSGDALFDPDRALDRPLPPTGAYRCRLYRLGVSGGPAPAWTACRIDGQDFRMTAGPERPMGRLFEDSGSRAIFLGTLLVGDETRPIRYGRDTRRDLAGMVERVGTARWRVVLPYPGFGATLDLIELVPVQ